VGTPDIDSGMGGARDGVVSGTNPVSRARKFTYNALRK